MFVVRLNFVCCEVFLKYEARSFMVHRFVFIIAYHVILGNFMVSNHGECSECNFFLVKFLTELT